MRCSMNEDEGAVSDALLDLCSGDWLAVQYIGDDGWARHDLGRRILLMETLVVVSMWAGCRDGDSCC